MCMFMAGWMAGCCNRAGLPGQTSLHRSTDRPTDHPPTPNPHRRGVPKHPTDDSHSILSHPKPTDGGRETPKPDGLTLHHCTTPPTGGAEEPVRGAGAGLRQGLQEARQQGTSLFIYLIWMCGACGWEGPIPKCVYMDWRGPIPIDRSRLPRRPTPCRSPALTPLPTKPTNTNQNRPTRSTSSTPCKPLRHAGATPVAPSAARLVDVHAWRLVAGGERELCVNTRQERGLGSKGWVVGL